MASPQGPEFYVRLGIGLLLFAHPSGSYAQTKVEPKRESNLALRCVIETDRAEWNPTAPAVVTGKVENLSDGPLEIAVQPALYLTSKTSSEERDKYWSPVDLFHNSTLGTDRHAIGAKGEAEAITAQPVRLQFKSKGDIIAFRIDVRDILWAREISSVWPSEKFFAVVDSGAYDLELVLETKSGDSKSDKLTIAVAAGEPQKQ